MLKKLTALLVVAVLSLSCTPLTRPNAPAPVTPSPNASEAEYAVYQALIKSYYADEKLGLGMIVIRDHTSSGLGQVGNDDKQFESLQKALPEVDQSLLDGFLAQNAQSVPLEDRFNLKIPVTLLSQADFDSYFGKNGAGWDNFYFEYPKSQGVLTLSRVGFNAQADKALVYAGNQGYTLAGAGYAVVLGLENGQWQVLNQVMLWVS